ncbi:MAG: hypothetical protein GC153_08020 [Alphaproteobacteria bacterium]|nr:hypothetical protein [Alphaproteobacteria bacterium]
MIRTFFKNQFRRLVSFITREAVAELERLRKADAAHSNRPPAAANADDAPPVRIDIARAIRDLGTPEANAALQNFYAGNHRFVALLAEKNRRAAADTYDYVDAAMPKAMFVLNQFRFIQAKREAIMTLGGSILDLGVYKGGSTRELARIFPSETIHGFDSFEGLPFDWTHALKGSFGDVKGVLPNMPDNVRLYKGWFDETLPKWLELNRDRPISLLRVDCDIYESTKTIFNTLNPLIRPGTWIVFDELIGYRGFREHELKAFEEFIAETGYDYDFVAYGMTYAICRLKTRAGDCAAESETTTATMR